MGSRPRALRGGQFAPPPPARPRVPTRLWAAHPAQQRAAGRGPGGGLWSAPRRPRPPLSRTRSGAASPLVVPLPVQTPTHPSPNRLSAERGALTGTLLPCSCHLRPPVNRPPWCFAVLRRRRRSLPLPLRRLRPPPTRRARTARCRTARLSSSTRPRRHASSSSRARSSRSRRRAARSRLAMRCRATRRCRC